MTGIIALAIILWPPYDQQPPVHTYGDTALSGAADAEGNGSAGEASDNGLPGYTILIDAGHGGKDPGAGGASGEEEKDFTLSLARKVYALLEQDPLYNPYMTRTDDTFIELEERSGYSNELGADAFLSIHGNTFQDSRVSGTETYYDAASSFPLANSIHRKLAGATGFPDRGVKQEQWKVLEGNESPAILMELGFMTNPEEEAQMLDEAWQDRVAGAIVEGLKEYFSENNRGDGLSDEIP
ncbi:N-acetylmuramoyl-L-alanine amidase family protein [Paenibacillus harenae]|uniref:N-acetylmuramoyl-L-alanine amidase n=1 Tax=Paenibacillus harenae TaxID=306543 RepID=A0ABT9U5E3_PAEHA|nr:N-acetylmuramoyl-L-alanine amidase [Paenibacillus harenae]MDQ0114855.1 N-acetylmuramoyl-L-alanine amidase [Paenibacillus harenae]